MIGRLATIGVLTALLATVLAAPAGADELDDLLDAASNADYAGRQIIVTFIDGSTSLDIVDVEHAGSLMIVDAGGKESLLGAGRVTTGDGGGLTVASWNASQMSDRYSIGASQSVRRIDRAATSIEIMENGRVRTKLVFDDATGTPLAAEVYDGDGALFRLTAMLEVDSIPSKLYSAQGPRSDEYEVLVPTAQHSLPGEAAGYRLADAYAGPDESVQGFYSDGLFSFSLFVVDGPADLSRLAEASTIEVGGHQYRRMVDPAEMWVTWRSGGNTYVLVGDLPPDHMEAVLGELPQPSRRNLFSRLWSGIFG